ncbi:RNase adapter RapZ [Pseudomonas sp. G11-1]|uniref:RNase adapter RapZ n=1 Tax=Halopseudomonas bauzanensis TaxID=653930 RepID=A0A031M831_9GAMM|nr:MULTISPECIES: RNase adapter RapZ [Halopseudomonas]MCO5787293.1 RNase adapter RapZ [Pseudomonas sp. G11-1]MCO5790518.1 RNase adapter RapZ [Pseudomonas sp. G11-2]EZQ15909.1 glmZ(sRNA)-inactivating NTPase [Halopseudomonas bauzanensis]TKA92006.1 RNase adapter RapZ [Halopseudomonas bauzanensis]WGK62245.1 RNase adapter RapZ [Halopseudomonas sp. SMJS2]
MRLVVVSGRSGSGKSTALHLLEDNGFYCIDNLPAGLLPELARQANNTDLSLPKVAISIDARNLPSDLERFPDLLKQVRDAGIHCDVLFLAATDEVLIKRFSETRRKHPLTDGNLSLGEAIAAELKLLEPIIDLASLKIDTSHLTLYQLRDLLKQRLLSSQSNSPSILIQSFGFKRGVPVDADLVFDVRCLPNPYWKPDLRPFSGKDQQIRDYLDAEPDVQDMYQDIFYFLQKWLPRYAAGERSYMSIGIGCTGGHHRSVYIAERLVRELSVHSSNLLIRHRDLP